ncbi:hypothetical protein [Paenibacillus sp. FSL H3-0286]|uniref:hypothetical protein n=1 Tax=Paenibacillus sp. FSL H3-0286 TaxID=2921427 RepID=UPI0032430AD8
MEKKLAFKEVPQKVLEILKSGEQFSGFDSIYHCLSHGWLDLYETIDGNYYIYTRISEHSEEGEDAPLERMSKATYGSDAVLYQCIERSYLDLEFNGKAVWVTRDLDFE